MSLDELIQAWQAGEPDTIEALESLFGPAESDATSWDYYDSAIMDPIDEAERLAIASIGRRVLDAELHQD